MEEQIKKTFATPEGCDLVVENIQGRIDVKGWDRPETEVVAVRHQEWAEVEIHQEGRRVVARTEDERGPGGVLSWFGIKRVPAVDYTVHVPHASNLRLKSVNGPMHVAQVHGEIRTNNVDGSVTLDSIADQVICETVNGSVRAVHLEGEARLKAVNGKLQVQGGKLSGLTAEAVNGQIAGLGRPVAAHGVVAAPLLLAGLHDGQEQPSPAPPLRRNQWRSSLKLLYTQTRLLSMGKGQPQLFKLNSGLGG